jgi:hypothetical protein
MEDGDNSIVELERLQTVGINMGLLFQCWLLLFNWRSRMTYVGIILKRISTNWRQQEFILLLELWCEQKRFFSLRCALTIDITCFWNDKFLSQTRIWSLSKGSLKEKWTKLLKLVTNFTYAFFQVRNHWKTDQKNSDPFLSECVGLLTIRSPHCHHFLLLLLLVVRKLDYSTRVFSKT